MLISDDGEIIADHGRFAAAKMMGLEEIPVIRLAHLSEAQKRAYRLADNKIGENGGWNIELLKMELADLELNCEGLEITDTGFATLEIDNLFADKPEKATDTKKRPMKKSTPFHLFPMTKS